VIGRQVPERGTLDTTIAPIVAAARLPRAARDGRDGKRVVTYRRRLAVGSTQEFVDYVVGQLAADCDVSSKKMFGEYGLYSGAKFFGAVCDDQLFIKITDGGRAFIGDDAVEGQMYEGAKPSFLIGDEIEDVEWLSELVRITARELPEPKPKKKRRGS
jgi:TfoX/Sxy family transcriptional regulator of competence genes